MHPFVNIGIKAARAAGDIISQTWMRGDTLKITEKARHDFTTHIDKMADEAIIEVLHKAYPKHSFLSEESGEITYDDEYTWIIDPLDGTCNFMRQLPHFCISLALKHDGIIKHAVVCDPIRQEIFSASKNEGAQLNNKRIRCSKHNTLDGALIGTGTPFNSRSEFNKHLAHITSIQPFAASIRAMGSAALDLVYVACGRLDGYFKTGLKIWDVAGSTLILREAGGLVTDFSGGDNYFNGEEIIGSNPKIFNELLKGLQS